MGVQTFQTQASSYSYLPAFISTASFFNPYRAFAPLNPKPQTNRTCGDRLLSPSLKERGHAFIRVFLYVKEYILLVLEYLKHGT